MSMGEVVNHTPRQLKLIYAAFRKERAFMKLMELDNLAVVVFTAMGSKDGSFAKLQKSLAKMSEGRYEDGTEEDEKSQIKENISEHLKRMRGFGVKIQ